MTSLGVEEWTHIIASGGVIIGGLFALHKWLEESHERRELRNRELRWHQAESAKKLLDDLGQSEGAQNAFRMLDYDGLDYPLPSKKSAQISEKEYLVALRINDLRFTDAEIFVRDTFDSLFENMAIAEHHVRTGLVLFEDVRFPYDYYIPTMN